MLTRCPACATHFRVTTEQLKARSGRVRCGECQHVFSALDTLIEEPTVLVAAPVPEAVQDSVPAPVAEIETEAAAPLEAPGEEIAVSPAPTFEPVAEEPEELHVPEPEPEQRQELTQEPVTDAGNETAEIPEIEETQVVAVPAPEPEVTESNTVEPEPVAAQAANPVAAPSDTPAEVVEDAASRVTPPPVSKRWPHAPWAIGCVLALIVFGLQLAMSFRVELAVLAPSAKPALVSLCDIFGCEVGLPAKVSLVGIEASDLHPDNEHPGRLGLTATLKNRAPFAQQFPHLELTLTDTADKAIARKVMAPADYLPRRTAFAEGMPPNADIMVVVGIDPGEMAASGYRLYLFYP
jgi:predicted Zn finger-like uncharacterized protein